nr:chemotaxis protein CheB [Halobacillus sp. BBL2006]
MFKSLAELPKNHVTPVIMAGMGADGTVGLAQLKNAHPLNCSIVESEESCVVFGMPKSVIKSKLADEVVP